jgi:hypothetical protein
VTTKVKAAASWLRDVLDHHDGEMPVALLRVWAERAGIPERTLQRARPRAGVSWRREARFGGQPIWFVSGPPSDNYGPPPTPPFHPPRWGPKVTRWVGHSEPQPTDDATEIGLCDVCGAAWALDAGTPRVCLSVSCNGTLEPIATDVTRTHHVGGPPDVVPEPVTTDDTPTAFVPAGAGLCLRCGTPSFALGQLCRATGLHGPCLGLIR